MSKTYEQYSAIEIQDYLLSLIATTCNLPQEALPADLPIIELGIDSMIAAHINAQIEKSMGIELPFSEIVDNASIADIAHSIYQQLQKNGSMPLTNKLAKVIPDVESLITSQQTQAYFEKINVLDKSFHDIKALPQYKKITVQKSLFKKAQVQLPFHRCFNSSSTDTIQFENRALINFASYNYLGYNTDPLVNAAAEQAMAQFGTSASSSRIVSGEKPIHQALEAAISDLYQVESALVFVSGYATNVSVIGHLMDKNDLIIHDSLAHNSIVMGCQLSNAKRLKFPHNDLVALEQLLKENRLQYERVLIVVEGLYSMDGDTVPLAKLVALKKRYKCLLMIDEAHSIGVLGEKGLGIREHSQVAATDVDIWMGTLSKCFAGCGGYIAGCWELIDYLKYTVPGFIFSVGLAPPLAGASLKAIQLLKADNHRVKKLQENSQYFLSQAMQKGFNTGLAEGYAIIPIILGHSLDTAKLANSLFNQGINVQPIIYPGVEDSSARLRFFISALHSKQQIDSAIEHLEKCYFEQIGSRNEYYHTTC